MVCVEIFKFDHRVHFRPDTRPWRFCNCFDQVWKLLLLITEKTFSPQLKIKILYCQKNEIWNSITNIILYIHKIEFNNLTSICYYVPWPDVLKSD